MEEQKKGRSREQKNTWKGKGAEGNNCYWQEDQYVSVTFALVFSLNKVGPSLFQVCSNVWYAAEIPFASIGYSQLPLLGSILWIMPLF